MTIPVIIIVNTAGNGRLFSVIETSEDVRVGSAALIRLHLPLGSLQTP